VAGEVPPFKISEYVPKSYRKATKVMARDIELAGRCRRRCIQGCRPQIQSVHRHTLDPTGRFGCNIGAGLISVDLNEPDGCDELPARGTSWTCSAGARRHGAAHPGLAAQVPSEHAGLSRDIIHELKADNTITCADASSHLAIGEAFRTIQRGDADLAICGGTETKVVPMSLMRQILLKRVTETHNDSPARRFARSMPTADGTAVAEGGGLLILEEFEQPRPRREA